MELRFVRNIKFISFSRQSHFVDGKIVVLNSLIFFLIYKTKSYFSVL